MIADYFNALSDKIAAAIALGGSAAHRPDIGLNRESVLCSVLNRHLPQRMQALLGGTAIALDGSSSHQLDVMVRADNTPRFEENERTFFPVESLVGAITVKSRLDGDALVNALDNLASIPQLSPDVLSLRMLHEDSLDVFLSNHPSTYLYAFDGMNSDTCLDRLKDYFDAHPDYPINRVPREIVVHEQYSITFNNDIAMAKDGTVLPPRSFWPTPLDHHHRGFPLTRIVNHLYSYISWMPFLEVAFHRYVNASYGLPNDQFDSRHRTP